MEAELERSSRFQYLLQPIKDLAENWKIDIAKELEDYLEELETLQISVGPEGRKVDFVEAALLIQGATCVYSRKVEYLYQLVFDVLELLNNKKKQKEKGKKAGGGGQDHSEHGENVS